MYLHPLGEDAVVEFVDGGVDTVEHLRGVFAAQHLDDALDGVVAVVGVVAIAQHALALQGAVAQLAQLLQVDGGAVDGLDHDVAQAL